MRAKSDENWAVGTTFLKDQGFQNSAVSRLYYSVFQAVLYWARKKKGYMGSADLHAEMLKAIDDDRGGWRGDPYYRIFKLLRRLRETADYQEDKPDTSKLDADFISSCDTMRNHYLDTAEA